MQNATIAGSANLLYLRRITCQKKVILTVLFSTIVDSLAVAAKEGKTGYLQLS